jgi:hypothetical protein
MHIAVHVPGGTDPQVAGEQEHVSTDIPVDLEVAADPPTASPCGRV